MDFTFIAKFICGDLFDYIEIFNCQLISLTEFFNMISSYYTYINILFYLINNNVVAVVMVFQKYLCLLLCKLIITFVQASSKISFLPKDA